MNLKRVLEILVAEFQKEKVDFGLGNKIRKGDEENRIFV